MKSIPSILITNRYTDTVLKFSEGHIYVHWIILEVNRGGFERSRMFKNKEQGARSQEQEARSKEQGVRNEQ